MTEHAGPKCPHCHQPFPEDFDTDLEAWSCTRCRAPLKLVGEDWVVAEDDHEHSHPRHDRHEHTPPRRRRGHDRDEHDDKPEDKSTGTVPTWVIVVVAGALVALIGWLMM